MTTARRFRFEEWTQETELLPTLPDCTENIVDEQRGKWDKLVLTIQCAVCLRTYTHYMIIALHHINHGDFTSGGYSLPALPYKRCGKCRQERKYADGED